MITIEDFGRLNLRVATIAAAEPHPNADRLLVLQVDAGGDRRQLVAGIREHYAVEDLVGKQVVIVANLQPAVLRGVKSEGMILAASDEDGSLSLIAPERPVAPGSRVS
jgi:methionyl-tRNA synthetase